MNASFKSIVVATLCALLGVAGCEAAPGETSQEDPTGSTQQALDLCSPTGVTPHATLTELGAKASLDDQYVYGALGCRGYVVELTESSNATGIQTGLGVQWKHKSATSAECARLRVQYSLYSYNNGTWTANGTGTRSGHWNGAECVPGAFSGTPNLTFTTGTKWRVKANAFEQNCDGSDCYNDHKRVEVELSHIPE